MKFLADENFEGAIFRALLRRESDIDIVRVQDVGLTGLDDPEILEWADLQRRIVLTHDRRTMPNFVYQRIALGKSTSGLIVMKPTISISVAVEDILLINSVSTQIEWKNMVQFLPL